MIWQGLPDLMQSIRQDAGWSIKDLEWLTRKWVLVPVFVYGTHKERFSDHGLLKDCPRVGLGYTVDNHFEMFRTVEAEPVAFHTTNILDKGRLRGELYQVPPPVLFKLDQQFCNGIHFNRIETAIRWWSPDDKDVPYDKRQDFVSRAFMYLGNKPELSRLNGGRNLMPVSKFTFNAFDGTFFQFNEMHDIQRRQKMKSAANRETQII